MRKNENIKKILSGIYHPKLQTYLNDPRVLHEVSIENDDVSCTFNEPAGSIEINELKPIIEHKIFELNWVKSLEIKLRFTDQTKKKRSGNLKHVNHIIAVSSCKGGVGKSTIAMNLATAFHLNGASVGLFDADIHGPSLPTLITPTSMAASNSEEDIPPFINNGIKLMSYGYIQDTSHQPAILRGPIASNLFKQLLSKTDWGHLDVLIIDCPPGTGDIILSITQEIELTTSIIVTTPHELSYVDVKKGLEMFKKVKVPVTTIIENMSYFTPPNSTEKYHIFGKGRLIPTAKEYGIPNWLQLPINGKISSHANKKTPYLFNADERESQIYKKCVNDLVWAHSFETSEDTDLKLSNHNETQTLTLKSGDKEHIITYKALRNACQCAHCVDEMSRKKILDESTIDPKIIVDTVFNVGHYAFGIEWQEHNKTHHSMYTKEQLLTFFELETTGKKMK
jgi:Mrp family chromosome partitioning ATPase